MAKVWTKKEEGYLKKHYRGMSGRELAEKFAISPDAVRRKEKKLGLIREHPSRKKGKKKVHIVPRKWTREDELYIRGHYLKKTNAELAEKFKTTPKSVEKKLWRMGLKRRGEKPGVTEEERRRIKEFLREKNHLAGGMVKVNEYRSRAIVQFDEAIKLYHEKKYRQAERLFGKLIKDFSNVHDIVYKAKQYAGFCRDKK